MTFLFTDLEGSTQLVQRAKDAYGDILSDHRRLLREAVAASGGHEIDCRADEFFIAFRGARDAVAAALAGQRAFAAHPWPGGLDVRVRMGIHTGEPSVGDEGYLGLDVHRAARIAAAGHGGQVLLSQTTRDLLGGGDAAGVRLKDLGEHELPDLPRPERIYQIVAPDLPAEFPPLRTPKESAFRGEESKLGEAALAATSNGGDKRLRVILADDAVLLREGVARILEEAGFDVVGQAGTPDELLLRVRSYSPDVAVVDIRMPPTHTDEGLRAAQEIRARHPGVGVLVLSQYVEPAYAMELLAENAEGVG